jgi:hypothetical protein
MTSTKSLPLVSVIMPVYNRENYPKSIFLNQNILFEYGEKANNFIIENFNFEDSATIIENIMYDISKLTKGERNE